jgi:hypothetical protein
MWVEQSEKFQARRLMFAVSVYGLPEKILDDGSWCDDSIRPRRLETGPIPSLSSCRRLVSRQGARNERARSHHGGNNHGIVAAEGGTHDY